MRLKVRIIMSILALAAILVSFGAILSFAESEIVTEGEMISIKNEFTEYLVQDTRRIENDGYVGAVQYTVYYDKTLPSVTGGIGGTPIIVYAVNTNTERVGTDSNSVIIQSMLERGYLVVVLDYLSNTAACGHELDCSAQNFVNNLKTGKYFDKSNSVFASSGSYYDVYVAPSGYNVLLGKTFWEVDKHSADGTLEKIVENWNTDFKGTKAERLVKWATGDTVDTRKAVANASDGSSVVWYNQSGGVDANGLYTKVKYTVAETITDCVKPDGSPLDLDLKLHLVYPTNPENEVPLLSVSCCWGYATNTIKCYTDLCAHHTGALFRGYAGAVYDYFWQPMARDDAFGYYDGNLNTNGAVTGDHMNYSLHLYNDKLINTAAIRCLRYLALSESETYKFDLDAFCTIGLSKGGWFTFLGEEVLQSGLAEGEYGSVQELESAIDKALAEFTSRRIFEGHHGETRYQAGNTEAVEAGCYVGENAICGGEKQPWLTYEGVEIISGVQLTYAANGSQQEDVSEGHAPMFAAAHMNDEYNAAYGSANVLFNLARSLDIPFVFFEVDQLHEFAYFPDMFYGVETYDAFFDFANYYLKNEAIKVLYTDPYVNDGDVSLTDKITIQFSGEATLEQVMKITVSANGEALLGSWESVFGGTQWIFHPENMMGGVEYTITVPADFTGHNGVAIAESYVSAFITEGSGDTMLTLSEGTYSFTAPDSLPEGKDSFVFRFGVSNNAANVAELYEGDGALLGSVNLRGSGTYEIDITDYVCQRAGEEISLTLKEGRTASKTVLTERDFSNTSNTGTYVKAPHAIVTLDENGNEASSGDSAIRVYIDDNEGSYGGGDVHYENVASALALRRLLGTDKITKADYGRQINITLRFIDTTSRTLQLKMYGMTSSSLGVMDYDQPFYNVKTKAGEWMEVTVPYTVYETDYGYTSNNTQTLFVAVSPSGNTNMPIYFSHLTVEETVTEIDVTSAFISAKALGKAPYKAPEAETAFVVYDGEGNALGGFDSWAEALSAASDGYTVKLCANYTLTDSELSSDIGSRLSNIVVDLNGYNVKCANTVNSFIWVRNTALGFDKTAVTVKNGGIELIDTPLITYGNSNSLGKSVDLTLDGVKIRVGKSAMLTELISESKISAGEVIADITLNECDIDLGDEDDRATVMLTLLPEGQGNLKLHYTLCGGSIRASHPRWIQIQQKATYSDYTVGENGHTRLYLPAPYLPSAKVSYIVEEGYSQYETVSTADNVTEYALVRGEGSTRYGVIPETYTNNAASYPFVLFKEGAFVGAYSGWREAMLAAQSAVGSSAYLESEAQLLLRADYKINANSNDAGPQINLATSILIDLGGYSLITDDVGLDLVAGYSAAPYATNITVKNGSVLSGRIAFIDGQIFSAANGVKIFNVRFESVTFGFDSGIGDFWGDMLYTPWTTVDTANGAEFNLVYENCTFDLRNYPLAKSFNVFNPRDSRCVLDTSIELIGGEILMDSADYVNFAALDADDSITVSADSNGAYTALKTTSGVKPLSNNFVDENGVNRAFVLKFDDGESAVYALESNPLATDYGVIGSEYSDAEAYPIAVFKDGVFVGAYSTWNSATSAAQSATQGAENLNSTAVMLLRRDFGNYGSDSGAIINTATNIVFDLNGYTFTNDWTGLDLSGNYNNAPYKTKVTIKNGSIFMTRGIPFLDIQHTSGDKTKEFEAVFESVTFGFAEGAETTWGDRAMLLVTWGANAGEGSSLNLSYNDCVFNLRDNLPSDVSADNKYYLFRAYDGNANADVHINVCGGEIICNDLNCFEIFTSDSNDSIVWKEGSDGKHTKLITPSTPQFSTSHYTGVFNGESSDLYFVETEDDSINSTYYLTSLATSGGTVPHSTVTEHPEYLSALDYPFFVFRDGSLKFVEKVTTSSSTWGWQMTLAHVKDQPSGTNTTIVLRRDYATLSNDNTDSFVKRIKTNLTIDLAGYTFNCANKYMLDLYCNENQYAQLTTIVVKNGSVVTSWGNPIVGVNHGNSLTSEAKKFNLTFDNVTFKDTLGTASYIILASWDNGSAKGIDATVTFNDCIFDLRGAKSGAVMLNAGTNKALTAIDVFFNGGKIISDNFSGSKLYAIGSEDSAVFGLGSNGKYTSVQIPANASIPTVNYKNADGQTLTLGSSSVSGEYAIYTLGVAIETEYGWISHTYSSADEYPFALFTESGSFIGGYKDLGTALNAALAESGSGRYVVLARRDSVNDTSAKLTALTGRITVDLAGYTVEVTDKANYLVDIYVNDAVGRSTGKIIFSDGSIRKIGGHSLICVNYGSGLKSIDSIYNIEFNGVTFSSASSSKAASVVLHTWSGSADATAKVYTYVDFNDCTFDYVSSVSGVKMLVMTNGSLGTVFNVTVNGGRITANDGSVLNGFASLDENDKLSFGKNNLGRDVNLVIPTGSIAPSETIVYNSVDNLECIFKKISTMNGYDYYQLTPKAIFNFGIKTSITLSSELVYNVYVPAFAEVSGIELDGAKLDLEGLYSDIVDINGADYYRIKIELPSAVALRSIIAKVYLDTDFGEFTYTYTLGVLKYAKMITGGEYSEIEKTLALDVLAYALAANSYFGEYSENLTAAQTVLGDYSKEFSKVEGTTSHANGIDNVTLVLDAKPVIRFYGTASANYTYKCGNITLNAVYNAEGEYTDVYLYAYQLISTITYTDGTNSGSYHINSYYDYVSGAEYSAEDKETLVDLVQKLYNYCKSAEAYRVGNK